MQKIHITSESLSFYSRQGKQAARTHRNTRSPSCRFKKHMSRGSSKSHIHTLAFCQAARFIRGQQSRVLPTSCRHDKSTLTLTLAFHRFTISISHFLSSSLNKIQLYKKLRGIRASLLTLTSLSLGVCVCLLHEIPALPGSLIFFHQHVCALSLEVPTGSPLIMRHGFASQACQQSTMGVNMLRPRQVPWHFKPQMSAVICDELQMSSFNVTVTKQGNNL